MSITNRNFVDIFKVEADNPAKVLYLFNQILKLMDYLILQESTPILSELIKLINLFKKETGIKENSEYFLEKRRIASPINSKIHQCFRSEGFKYLQTDPVKKICQHHLRGICKFGRSCKYSHDPEPFNSFEFDKSEKSEAYFDLMKLMDKYSEEAVIHAFRCYEETKEKQLIRKFDSLQDDLFKIFSETVSLQSAQEWISKVESKTVNYGSRPNEKTREIQCYFNPKIREIESKLSSSRLIPSSCKDYIPNVQEELSLMFFGIEYEIGEPRSIKLSGH